MKNEQRLWAALCAAVLLLGHGSLFAQAQREKPYRVAHLSGGVKTPDGAAAPALREALRGLGYAEDKNITYVARFAEGRTERLAALAQELVRLNVDVIVVQGGPAALAARAATSTIPIVLAPAAGDAVAAGLISSLAHPGGNVTGLSDESIDLSAKRIQLLKEMVPKARSIAVLWNANDQGMVLRYQGIAKAAQSMGLEVRAFGLRTPASFDEAFASMTARQPDALVLVHDVLTLMNRQQVLSFAAKHRIPAMYETGNYVIGGGLMSYGPDPDDGFRVAARFVDSLIKGRKPADLPAEQPTRLELFVNVKTAKAIGVAIPQTVLVRADRVIE